MCESALAIRAAEFNAGKTDEIPVEFFHGPDCTTTSFTLTLNAGQRMDINTTRDTAASIVVPFNYDLRVYGAGYGGSGLSGEYYVDLRGPVTVRDVRAWSYTHHNGQPVPMGVSEALQWDQRIRQKAYQITRRADWQSEVAAMCMGRTRTLGGSALNRYSPQSPACDAFMRDVWCAGGNEVLHEECGCFPEERRLLELSRRADVGVALPVVCFGEKCATGDCYRTKAMADLPCNVTICRQALQLMGGAAKGSLDLTIHCNGSFYTAAPQSAEEMEAAAKKAAESGSALPPPDAGGAPAGGAPAGPGALEFKSLEFSERAISPEEAAAAEAAAKAKTGEPETYTPLVTYAIAGAVVLIAVVFAVVVFMRRRRRRKDTARKDAGLSQTPARAPAPLAQPASRPPPQGQAGPRPPGPRSAPPPPPPQKPPR